MTNSLCSKKTFAILLAFFIVSRAVASCFVSLVDTSEARYATIAKNMAHTNHFWEPRFYFEGVSQVFTVKPPLTFQLSALSCKVFGENPFAVRFPALLSAVAILGMIYLNVRRLRNEQTAMAATLLCTCSCMFFFYAGMTMTDLILTAAVIGGIFSYIRFEATENVREKKLFSLLYFATLAFGTLVKGPVALVMAGLPVFFHVLINNRWKELRYHAWFLGSLCFLLITVPYYAYMDFRYPGFVHYFIVEETFQRYLAKEVDIKLGDTRDSFRGAAFLFFIALNLPVLVLTQFHSWRKFAQVHHHSLWKDPLSGIAALTCLTVTLFWCLTERALITYLLPTVPMLAVFLATRFNDCGFWESPRFTRGLRWFIVTFLLLHPLLLTVSAVVGSQVSTEVVQPFYQRALAHLQTDARYPKAKLYFAGTLPFSGEFYLPPESFVLHEPDKTPESWLESSRHDFLAINQHQMDELDHPIERELLVHYGLWYLFAPVESEAKPETEPDAEPKAEPEAKPETTPETKPADGTIPTP